MTSAPSREDKAKVAHRVSGARSVADRDELLRLAVDVGSIGIFETDFESNETRFSSELCSILGLLPGARMSYKRAALFFHEEDRAVVRQSLDAAEGGADKGKWSGIYRIVRTDGQVRWVSIQGRRFYRGREVVRSIGTVIDVTRLKETEQALRKSELRLRLALEAAEIGTFEADTSAREAIIDDQEARLLGLPKGTTTVSVEELRRRIPAEDLLQSDAKQHRLVNDKIAYQHEFRLRMPDGSERWLSGRADIRSNRIFGVNFDITRHKLAEAALQGSEARLRVAAEAANLGVFEWDPDLDITVWENDRIYEIFARAKSAGPVGKQEFLEKYLHPSDASNFEATLQRAMDTRGRLQVKCRIRTTVGPTRWVQIEGKFEPHNGTGRLRLIGVVADITAQRRLEMRAKRLSQRLQMIQDEERRNIAQELHDSTVQHLVAGSLTLTALRSDAIGDKEVLWKEAEGSFAEAIKELRTFSYLMHPPALRARGLGLALRQYVEGVSTRSGLHITLRCNAKVDALPFRMQRALFRIVQEAVANVYRHASASRATITCRLFKNSIHVIVVDDGRGMASTRHGRPALHHGMGLRGIKARLDQVGGRLIIRKAKPNGTILHATLPIAVADADRTGRAARIDAEGN